MRLAIGRFWTTWKTWRKFEERNTRRHRCRAWSPWRRADQVVAWLREDNEPLFFSGTFPRSSPNAYFRRTRTWKFDHALVEKCQLVRGERWPRKAVDQTAKGRWCSNDKIRCFLPFRVFRPVCKMISQTLSSNTRPNLCQRYRTTSKSRSQVLDAFSCFRHIFG